MKNVLSILAVTFALTANAQVEYVKIGNTPNNLVSRNEKVYSINSGFSSQPSVAVYNLTTHAVTTSLLAKKTNPYRSVIVGDSLFLTLNLTDEVVQIPLSDIGSVSDLKYKTLFQSDISIRGAESIIAVGGDLWVAYSHMNKDYSYGSAEIFILSPKNGSFVVSHELRLAEKNPKALLALPDGRVAIALGEYGKDDGSIALVDPKKIPTTVSLLSTDAKSPAPFIQYAPTGGTPGSLSYRKGSVWSCDLGSTKQSTAYALYLPTGKTTRYPLPFPTCGGVSAAENQIYFLSLNGGGAKAPKQHLYSYDASTFTRTCALELVPPGYSSPVENFPSDLLPIPAAKKLAVLLGGTGFMAVLDTDSAGKVVGCVP